MGQCKDYIMEHMEGLETVNEAKYENVRMFVYKGSTRIGAQEMTKILTTELLDEDGAEKFMKYRQEFFKSLTKYANSGMNALTTFVDNNFIGDYKAVSKFPQPIPDTTPILQIWSEDKKYSVILADCKTNYKELSII